MQPNTIHTHDVPHRLTVGEIADLYSVHPETVRRWARRDGAPALNIGGQWRLDPMALEQWLLHRSQPPQP